LVRSRKSSELGLTQLRGTPLPIWRNVDDASDYFVVGSAEELKQLGSVGALDDLHKSKVDAVVITRVSPKDGKSHQYKRVPDVLDVWVDAGSASWNALEDATAVSKLSSEWFPIDLILGKVFHDI
jgi:isoleucyl-tRNA synthetase